MVEKIFQRKFVRPMLPKFMSNIREPKNNHLIVESIKFGVSKHIANGHITKHCAPRELIIRTLASTKYASGRTVAKN